MTGPTDGPHGDADAPLYPGIALPAPRYRAGGAPRARYLLVLGLLALGLGIGYAVIGVWDRLVDDVSYRCPPDCGGPPIAAPVATLPIFTAPDGKFSVAYPAPGSTYEVTAQPDGVTARLTSGDGGVLRLFSEPADGRVARQVVDQLLRTYSDATIAYELPNTAVGYQIGYGVVADAQGPSRFDTRLIVMAAIKNDLALIAVAEGPYRRFSPDFGPGPPSGANLEIAMDMGKFVESFSWEGDPPR